jgi:hypothetical protein
MFLFGWVAIARWVDICTQSPSLTRPRSDPRGSFVLRCLFQRHTTNVLSARLMSPFVNVIRIRKSFAAAEVNDNAPARLLLLVLSCFCCFGQSIMGTIFRGRRC